MAALALDNPPKVCFDCRPNSEIVNTGIVESTGWLDIILFHFDRYDWVIQERIAVDFIDVPAGSSVDLEEYCSGWIADAAGHYKVEARHTDDVTGVSWIAEWEYVVVE